MGGLVARYYAHVLDDRQLTRRIVTIATRYQGAVKALAVLANGHATLGLEITGQRLEAGARHGPDVVVTTSGDGGLRLEFEGPPEPHPRGR